MSRLGQLPQPPNQSPVQPPREPENSSLNTSHIMVLPCPKPSMAPHSFRRKAISSMMDKTFSCLALNYSPSLIICHFYPLPSFQINQQENLILA